MQQKNRPFVRTFFSPAKLNLFFRVLKKRKDGFHDIFSLFQAIDLADKLTFCVHDSYDQFTCSDPTLPLDSSNLVQKAIALFKQKTKKSFFLHVHLEKNIPVLAGLGGGSSNAATTLWALNELWDRPLSLPALQTLAISLGSDVNFFFSSGSAFCSGRGEELQENPDPQPFSCHIAKPSFGLCTKDVFEKVQIHQLAKRDPKNLLKSFEDKKPCYFNDLESFAFQLQPQMKKIKQDLLRLGFQQVIMTGSGSAFFCLGDVNAVSTKDVKFYSAKSICRTLDTWYLKKED